MTTLAAPTRAAPSLALGVALLALLVSLTPSALAQGLPPPSVTVTLAESALDVGAANTSTLSGTVAYADTAPAVPGGAADGQVTLLVTVPDGWTVTIEPASAFTLAPGASAPFELTLVAPAAGEGAATGSAVVTASATSTGGRAAEGSATLALTRIDPAPAPPPPWWQTPSGIAAIVGASLLVLGVLAYAVRRRRAARLAEERALEDAAARAAYMDRETGITLALADGPLQYGHRREIMYRIAVTNQSARPRVAIVDIAEATNGWRAATQVTKLPLSVGETQTLTVVVTPDVDITPGDRATAIVRAKPEEARERDERLTLDVVAPKSGVPTDPHYRIVAVQREGANKQIARR